MKITSYFNLLFIFFIVLYSCSDKEPIIGKWDDCIKLATKAVEFNATADSVTIKTGGTCWWISGVSVDDNYFSNFVGVNIEADSYVIKQDCFVVERRDKNTLFIKVNENPLSVQRIITIGLEAGDYFDGVTITQKSK